MNNDNNNNINKNDEDDYIKNKINSVFQPLILQMSLEQPKEPIKYMIESQGTSSTGASDKYILTNSEEVSKSP